GPNTTLSLTAKPQPIPASNIGRHSLPVRPPPPTPSNQSPFARLASSRVAIGRKRNARLSDPMPPKPGSARVGSGAALSENATPRRRSPPNTHGENER